MTPGRSLLRSLDKAEIARGLALAAASDRPEPLLELYRCLRRICYPDDAGELTIAQILEMNEQVEPDLVPRCASSIEETTELDLGGYAEIRMFPELLRFTNLERLHLWDNAGEFPAELAQLPKLTFLSIRDRLAAVPPVIGRMTALEELDLSSNQLDELPDEMASLPHLRILDLSCNRFASIPAWLAELPALRRLDLRHNQEAGVTVQLPAALEHRGELEILR